MKPRILTSSFFTAALLVAALLLLHPGIQAAAPPEDNPQVTKLLEDIKVQMGDLQRDAEALETFTRQNLSWESHAEELNRMKDQINAIGETIKKLQSMRSSAAPWQQEAIDRIIPLAQKLAQNTQAAIEHLNRNPLQLHDPQYQQYLKSNAEVAANLNALVRDFVEYGKTKSNMESLESRLEVRR